MRKIVLESLGLVFCVAIAATARAQAPATGANQNFPIKPLRMFVGYPPGGRCGCRGAIGIDGVE